jgi:hypothetical protein
MSRRLILLASLMLLGLSGCVTMNDGYYRQGYYSDGGYYYPAEDGYGDYYQGPEDVDYRYYDSYSYSPFWSLSRYSCGPYYSCSPYWNNYYRRPYSGWGLSFGSHWSYGSWGWYGNRWNPWYDHRDYWRQPRHPDPGHNRPPGNRDNLRPPRQDYTGQPRPGLREPGVIDDNGGTFPRPRPRPGNGNGNGSGPGPGQVVVPPGAERDGLVRPLPRPDFRERYEPKPVRRNEPVMRPGGGSWSPPADDAGGSRPVYRDVDERPGLAPRYERPEPREMPRYERPEPREAPRYERPEPREMPRYERPEPRETPRYEAPEPREAPRYERPDPPEVRSSSQNESSDVE